MTVSSYHERALASTDSRCETGGMFPFLSSSGAVSSPDSPLLESSFFSGSAFFDVRRDLASCAGPGGYPAFGHSVRALTCESLRHTCRWGRSQGFVTRLWSAILPPALCALSVQAWWRFAAWPVAGCVVGIWALAVWRWDLQEGVALKKSRK